MPLSAMAGAAPEGAVEKERQVASLRRGPDTKQEFFLSLSGNLYFCGKFAIRNRTTFSPIIIRISCSE